MPLVRDGWKLSRAERVLLAAGLLFGAYLRLRDVSGAFLFGDEFHSLRHLRRPLGDALTVFDPNGSGLALPLLQRLLAGLIGLDHWSLRLPAVCGSLGALVLVFPLARHFVGPRAGLCASLLFAVGPLDVFYGHFGRIYALASLFVLLLLFACARMCSAEKPGWREIGLAAGSLALLPWMHLATLGTALGMLGGTVAALAVDPPRRSRLKGLALTLALGAAGAALLQGPAFSSTLKFVLRKTEQEEYYGSFGPGDVFVLLSGHWTLALALGALALCGTALFCVQRRMAALPVLCAAVVPWVVLWTTRPFGDAYAYARYLMPAVVPLWIFAGHALAQVSAWACPRRPIAASSAVAVLIAACAFLRGPLGLAHTPDGPYANTYLSLAPLPRFDLPFPEMPAFYRRWMSGEASEDEPSPVTLIEAPALLNRSRHLYRNYYLQHRQPTWLGFLPEELDLVPRGPYVSLADTEALRASGARYLILHHDVAAEVERYWAFVYGNGSALGGAPGVRALMERQQEFGRNLARPSRTLVEALGQAFGEAVHADRDIVVWDLRGATDRRLVAPR